MHTQVHTNKYIHTHTHTHTHAHTHTHTAPAPIHTRLDTWLLQSRAGGQGLYSKSLLSDLRTDGRTERGIESRVYDSKFSLNDTNFLFIHTPGCVLVLAKKISGLLHVPLSATFLNFKITAL